MLLVGMGSLWIYKGCDKCGWRFGGRGFVGVPILSLKLGLSFGFALNFCCGYQCICRFMVGAVEGCCRGDGDGFTVGLRRWLRIWAKFVLCCSGSMGLCVLQWV